MKKFFILMTAFLLSTSAFAQIDAQANLHVNQGLPVGTLKGTTATLVMFEGTLITGNTNTYALLQNTFSKSNFTYAQLFHEFRFWTLPLYGHMEFRTYNFDYNIVYLGAAYDFFTTHGYIAVEPLYRNNSLDIFHNKGWRWDAGSFQLSAVTGHDWDICNLNSFTDVWTRSKDGSGAGWYSEAWLYFPIVSCLQLGAIIQLGAEEDKGFSYTLYPGLKIVF